MRKGMGMLKKVSGYTGPSEFNPGETQHELSGIAEKFERMLNESGANILAKKIPVKGSSILNTDYVYSLVIYKHNGQLIYPVRS